MLFVSSKFLLPSVDLEGAASEEAFAKAASSALFSVTWLLQSRSRSLHEGSINLKCRCARPFEDVIAGRRA